MRAAKDVIGHNSVSKSKMTRSLAANRPFLYGKAKATKSGLI